MLMMALYILATVATAFAFAPWCFFVCRFFTGMGIGGEYAAINSAIDELIPARNRGQVDVAINGSFWIGAAIGAVVSLALLDTALFATDVGWRLAFGAGALLGLGILLVRRHVPESPRWLFIHGREEEAERVVEQIEAEVRAETGAELLFALSNFLGPLLLGRLFDTVGRMPMIAGTYLGSATLVVVLAVLLRDGSLDTTSFMALIMATFFLASAGASAAYLTVSEVFPMETRALAIAFFYAIGTAIGTAPDRCCSATSSTAATRRRSRPVFSSVPAPWRSAASPSSCGAFAPRAGRWRRSRRR
jgi:MFS family permease